MVGLYFVQSEFQEGGGKGSKFREMKFSQEFIVKLKIRDDKGVKESRRKVEGLGISYRKGKKE